MNRAYLALVILPAVFSGWGSERLTVLSYNIHHGEGSYGSVDLERIAAVIRAEHPDIVCLQEVDEGLPRTAHVDMPRALGALLEMRVIFGENYAFEGGHYGNATLTRLPVLDSRNQRLPGPEGAEPRGCLRVTIKAGGHMIDVFNTHLGLGLDERREQAAAIVAMVSERPAILAGDLNDVPHSPTLEILHTVFEDTYWSASSDDGTLPGAAAPRRIDYVLTTRDLRGTAGRVISEGDAPVASDHLPYVARVDLGAVPERLEDLGIVSNEDERLNEALIQEPR